MRHQCNAKNVPARGAEAPTPRCYNLDANGKVRVRGRIDFLVAVRRLVGEWLSLVEHLVRDQGVGGSNPLSPTNCFQSLTILQILQIEPLVRLLWVPNLSIDFNKG